MHHGRNKQCISGAHVAARRTVAVSTPICFCVQTSLHSFSTGHMEQIYNSPEVQALELLLLSHDGVADGAVAGLQRPQVAPRVLQRRLQHLLLG